MATPVRQKKQRFANRVVRAKIEEPHDSEYAVIVTLVDADENQSDGETWQYGVTEDREAELRRTTAVDDLLAEPDPPEWVQRAFESWGITLV